MSQRELVDQHNSDLFFQELFPAFGTHPRLGNLFIYRNRDHLLVRLNEEGKTCDVNCKQISDYTEMLAYSSLTANIDPAILGAGADLAVPGSVELTSLFTELHSHKLINEFAKINSGIPLLKSQLGTDQVIEKFIQQYGKDRKIVPFHFRFRQLDIGYGGAHTHVRDASFLDWISFFREAYRAYPEVLFIALGRLNEKPLAMLDMPNIMSLRLLGMDLGHELNLIEHSDLFIGISSGFAAFANFSEIPYFIVKMTEASCAAYNIPFGENHLPFAQANQELVYGQDTADMLMELLIKGLKL